MLLKVNIQNGVVSDTDKREIGKAFKDINGYAFVEVHGDTNFLNNLIKAEELITEAGEIDVSDNLNVEKLVELRYKLSIIYANIASASSGYEGLFDAAYAERKIKQAELFIEKKNSEIKSPSDAICDNYAIINSVNEVDTQAYYSRMYKKAKVCLNGIEQCLNGFASTIKNAQNEKLRTPSDH